MKIAYLVNQYPKVSHSFIRREILALEGLGLSVERYSVRDPGEKLVDPEDRREHARTRRILDQGKTELLAALARTSAAIPAEFARALAVAYQIGRFSDRGLMLHAAYLAEACILREWLKQSGAEHVHAHFGTNSATVALLCHLLGGPPWSFTVHGPEEFDKPQLLHLGTKVKHSAFVVAISDFGRSQLYRWCDRNDWHKVQVVRCGLDPAFLEEPATPIPPAPRLVNVGRLNEQKGQLLLIEALGELKRRGRAFQFVFVGDGELRQPIEARIEALDLGDRVTITGWASAARVKEEIQKSRALILPSFAEGLPIVIMEALALGRPVLSTRVAGIPELVDASTGWLVAPGSVSALVEGLEAALACSETELASRAQIGRERVLDRHDAKKNAALLAELFRGGPRPGL